MPGCTIRQFVLIALALQTAIISADADGRGLLQSGVSCPAQIPACTARRCTTRILDSKETYVCLRCLNGYVPARGSDGRSIVQCVCPPGTYQVLTATSRSCQACPYGSYCLGGEKKATKPTEEAIGGQATPCNPPNGTTSGLTTKSEKSTKATDCIAKGGFVLPPRPGQSAVQCTGSTYAPALNRLKSCLPCPSGFEAPSDYNGTQEARNEVCQVPPGRFLESNVIRTCPVGLYRQHYVKVTDKAAIKCLSCMTGWTTVAIGSTNPMQCNKLLPGYMPDGTQAGMPVSVLPQSAFEVNAELCPYAYYNNGSRYWCAPCPMGSTTPWKGAMSVDDCLVPPGYYLKVTAPDQGTLQKCPYDHNGAAYYRSGWATRERAMGTDASEACTPCGEGVLGRYRDIDEIKDTGVMAAQDPFPGLVAASPWSCYILAGWGLVVDYTGNNTMKAVKPCPANTYGVSSEANGLMSSPCKACPMNTFSFEASSSYQDCMNYAGFGYTSEGANQCPQGHYALLASMEPCTPCPDGRTTDYTAGDASYQQTVDDCKVLPGYGVFSAAADNPWEPAELTATLRAERCPVGFFNPGDSEQGLLTDNPTCKRCPGGQSTSTDGSATCDVCAPGWGIPDSKPTSTDVEDCEPCTFGTYQSGGGMRCWQCPTTPFNHPVGAKYVSSGITFTTAMEGPETCVPRFSQLPSPAGARLAVDESVFSNNTQSNMDLESCLQSCAVDRCCIAQFEVEGSTCKRLELLPVGPQHSGAALYYKLPPSQLVSGATAPDAPTNDSVSAKTQPAGVYARCALDGELVALAKAGRIGTSTNPRLVEQQDAVEWGECDSELSCRMICQTNAACWGFIHVPEAGFGFATRGGEDQLGVRSFFGSPDFAEWSSLSENSMAVQSVTLPLTGSSNEDSWPGPSAMAASSSTVCPPGTGGMFFCDGVCPSGTFNDGLYLACQPCIQGLVSDAGASRCVRPAITTCGAGMGGAPSCSIECQPGTFNNGQFGSCQPCPAGRVSAAKASNCTVPVNTACPAGRGGLPRCAQNCRVANMYNNGSFASCQACPTGQKPNDRGTDCIDSIYKCPAGKALNVAQDACTERCPAGTYNDGNFAACVPCPAGQTSDPGTEGSSQCYYTVCPAGTGPTPECASKCLEGTYNAANFTSCQPCPSGEVSVPKLGGTRCMPLLQ